jgi:hypothetical protein
LCFFLGIALDIESSPLAVMLLTGVRPTDFRRPPCRTKSRAVIPGDRQYTSVLANTDQTGARMNNLGRLLTTRQAAERLQLSPATLANWRLLGKGPRFYRVGSRIRYREADVCAMAQEDTQEAETTEWSDDRSSYRRRTSF